MKIIIIEFVHYQYALTLTELFKEHEIIYIFSSKINESLKRFQPEFQSDNIWIIEPEDLKSNVANIIDKINYKNPDLFCINPIFDNFKEFAQIAQNVKAKKILTTHNINTWFHPKVRSLKDYNEKKYKKQIINNCDFIAVEDFIYQYLKEYKTSFFNKYNFIYIPYTLYKGYVNKIHRNDKKIKIVLPGSIDKERRTYDLTISVIKVLLKQNSDYIFSFTGPVIGEYGNYIISELKKIKKEFPKNIIFFEKQLTPEEFKSEMESSDIVLSTSTKYFYTLGTKEEIGKTKPTAAIHDMITFVMPGILPSHLNIPEGLKSSSLLYNSEKELLNIFLKLNDSTFFNKLKLQAQKNSENFTPEKILERNPNLKFINKK